jgi:hypothetical protein
MDVPVQYFQAVIALETAVTGVLLFQIRYRAADQDAAQEPGVDPRLRLLLLLVLAATIFGSLEAIREGGGLWSAVLVTVGLAVSVLPPLQRDALTQQRSALLGHRARPPRLRSYRPARRRSSLSWTRELGLRLGWGSRLW